MPERQGACPLQSRGHPPLTLLVVLAPKPASRDLSAALGGRRLAHRLLWLETHNNSAFMTGTGRSERPSSGHEREDHSMQDRLQSHAIAITLLGTALAALTAGAPPARAQAPAAPKKPNIVVIMGDDIGMWTSAHTTAA